MISPFTPFGPPAEHIAQRYDQSFAQAVTDWHANGKYAAGPAVPPEFAGKLPPITAATKQIDARTPRVNELLHELAAEIRMLAEDRGMERWLSLGAGTYRSDQLESRARKLIADLETLVNGNVAAAPQHSGLIPAQQATQVAAAVRGAHAANGPFGEANAGVEGPDNTGRVRAA